MNCALYLCIACLKSSSHTLSDQSEQRSHGGSEISKRPLKRKLDSKNTESDFGTGDDAPSAEQIQFLQQELAKTEKMRERLLILEAQVIFYTVYPSYNL
jgi:hypothetical protein